MTINELFQWAVSVRSCGGMRSAWPERVSLETKNTETATLHASTRRAGRAEGYPPVRKAIDILITVESCDTTSYLIPLLSAGTKEDQEVVWNKIPAAMICDGCRIRRYASQLRTKRCPRCGGTLKSYADMIMDDEEDAIKRLNRGGIHVDG